MSLSEGVNRATAASAAKCSGEKKGNTRLGATVRLACGLLLALFISIPLFGSPLKLTLELSTSPIDATLLQNLSDTLTVLSRSSSGAKTSCDFDSAIASITAIVKAEGYVYGVADGMETERTHDLGVLSDYLVNCDSPTAFQYASSGTWDAGTCNIALGNASVAIQEQTDPFNTLPLPSQPAPSTPSCSALLSKTSFFSGALQSNWIVTVTADCPWSAESDSAWLLLTPSADALKIQVLDNTTGVARLAHFTLAGASYSVFQEP